jgi:hypothetical protein
MCHFLQWTRPHHSQSQEVGGATGSESGSPSLVFRLCSSLAWARGLVLDLSAGVGCMSPVKRPGLRKNAQPLSCIDMAPGEMSGFGPRCQCIHWIVSPQ